MKPDVLVIFGPAPHPPDVVMDRILDRIEAGGGQLGRWYAEVQQDAYETGDPSFSVIHESNDLADRADLRARIRRHGSGSASYWSGRMGSSSEYAAVFEDPRPAPPDDLAPTERELLQALEAREPGAAPVYADWLERAGALDRAELLRLRDAQLSGGPTPATASRLRALARTLDPAWLARVHAITTTVLHLAASTSDPWSSGAARFVAPDPEHDDFRRETLATFEALALAIDATHFIAGADLFDWWRLDPDLFRAGPLSEAAPHHIAWRRDTFELAELSAWGPFAPGDIEHGPTFDHARRWRPPPPI